MSELTANRNTKERVPRQRRWSILDGEIIYAGGLLAIDSTPEIQMASDTAGLIVVGVSELYVDNTSDGEYATAKTGCFKFNNSSGNAVTAEHIGKTCWVEDDNTVASDPGTNGIEAGEVYQVDTDGVWVKVGAGVNAAPVAAAVSDPAGCASMTQDSLTGNSGGSATTTLAAVTAASEITDNSGGTDPGDDTIAAVTNTTELTDSGAGSADGTVEDVADIAISTSDTYSDAAVNTAVNTAIASISNNFKEMTTELAAQRTANTGILAAIAQLAAKQNTTGTAIGVLADAVASLAAQLAKVKTDNAAEKTAIDANNTAVDAVIDSLQAAGLMGS